MGGFGGGCGSGTGSNLSGLVVGNGLVFVVFFGLVPLGWVVCGTISGAVGGGVGGIGTNSNLACLSLTTSLGCS